MSYDDLTEIVPADPDSHFRLTECSCGSDHVAYVKMADELWRVRCFDCGATYPPAGCDSRHEAQVLWNKKEAA